VCHSFLRWSWHRELIRNQTNFSFPLSLRISKQSQAPPSRCTRSCNGKKRLRFPYSSCKVHSLSLSQAKDADAAAGRKSGGFCGGSTKGVHDPSKEPQAAPSQTPNSEPLKNELPHGQDPSSDAAAKNLPPPKVQKMLSERRFSDVVDFPQIHPVTPWTP
jgi:hypothetical protein